MPVIQALRRQRQDIYEFKASLGYMARSCLKKPKPKQRHYKNSNNKNLHWLVEWLNW
jgi:hypothetical protein